MQTPWWQPVDADRIPSPALLLFPDRIERNLRKMIEIAGGAERLRPHVKTHKLEWIVQLKRKLGIHKFKCATIAEAEMVARAGGKDVLLAYQPIGPNIPRLAELARTFPEVRWSTIIDSASVLDALASQFAGMPRPLDVLLDLNCGMNRSGIIPGDEAFSLYQRIHQSVGVRAAGLHVYDGHIHQPDRAERETACAAAFGPVEAFRKDLLSAGLPVAQVAAGGTPTFPIHARNPEYDCAPGTPVLWDFGYSEKFTDLPFEWAAVLLTRVASKPAPGTVCVDLGYKSVASEQPQPRVKFLNLPNAVIESHSEEHLVLQTNEPIEVGNVLYGIPRHICPTVACYTDVWMVEPGEISHSTAVTARSRRLTI